MRNFALKKRQDLGEHDTYPYYYFGQIEINGGVGLNFRFGFNVLEFIDFFLGWTTLDILGDDVTEEVSDSQ